MKVTTDMKSTVPEAAPGPGNMMAEGKPAPPRRKPWRAWLLRLHWWVGLTAGSIVSVVGLTGAIYLFQPEVTARAQAHLYRTEGGVEPLPATELARRAEAHFGAAVHSVQFPQRERETYMFKMKDMEGWYFFDPYSGAYLGEAPGKGFFGWVKDIHTSLLLGDVGYYVTGTASLLLALVLISSGIYLWWPRTWRILKHRLRVDWRASLGRKNFDLHAVGGFYVAPFLALLALTGAYFTFPVAYQWTVDRLTLSHSTGFDGWWDSTEYVTDAEPLNVVQALEIMARQYPGYYPRNLWMPADSAEGINFTFISDWKIHPGGYYRPIVVVGQYTGDILWQYDPRNAPLGQRILGNWIFPIHFAEIGGLPTRILGFFVCLMPLALLITGLRIHQGRNRSAKPTATL